MEELAADRQQRARLRRMQLWAGGLLLASLLLFIVAQLLHARHPAWGYVAAFAEAAVIGAMADWFAVVALFRHPLGIPVWHTAIIPRRKDDIARSLGQFIENHFITEEGITRRIRDADPATRIASWLLHPVNKARIGDAGARALRQLLLAIDDAEMSEAIRDIATRQLARIDLSGSAVTLADMLVEADKHQQLLNAVLDGIGGYLGNEENRPRITQFLISAFDIDNALLKMALGRYAPRAIVSLHGTVAAIRNDPEHAFRLSFGEWVDACIERLREDPEWRARIARHQSETLASPAVQSILAGFWDAIRDHLLDDLGRDDPRIAARTQALVDRIGRLLVTDESFRDWLNAAIEAGSRGLVHRYRGEAGKFIEQQLAQWTREEMSERIELALGRDLQFIRINGTVVGGLIGLLIYTALQLAGRS
ncbi:DUF445 domain-containing protein [Rhodocyclus purpureus]|uniref:DUF445 domain-containing protein n=1 Tax=Rhodocyclus purpureus TaxID=1067 RepID=UPI0030845F5B